MPVTGTAASVTGDKLKIDTVDPAFPQSIDTLGLQGGSEPEPGLGGGDLLIRVGFETDGQSASEDI